VSLVFPDRYENNLGANSAVTNDPDGVAQSISLVDGPDGDGVQDTLQFELADDGSDDSLPLEVGVDTGIDYPDVSSDTNLPVRFVFEDTNGDNIDQTFDTVFIQNDASADADLVVPTNGNNNTNFEDIAFQGQIVVGTNFNPGETVNVRRVTDSGDQLVREESADSTGEVTLDTADLSQAGDFFFVGQSSGNQSGFEHVIQTVDVEFEDDTVDNDAEVGTSRVNLSVESNRAGSFDHFVRSEQLNDEDLLQVFPSAVNPTDVDTDDDGETSNDGIRITAGQDAVAPVNFDGIETGNYSFTFNVTDTTASDDASVRVVEPGRGEITFENNIVSQARGDVASIEMNLENVDRGRLVIGSNESNFNSTVTFEDADDDGTVTITLNTLTPNEASAFDTENDDDIVNRQSLVVGTTEGKALDPINYELSVRLFDTDEQTDLGTLSVQPADARSITVATAPDGSFNDLTDLEEILERQENGEYTRPTTSHSGTSSSTSTMVPACSVRWQPRTAPVPRRSSSTRPRSTRARSTSSSTRRRTPERRTARSSGSTSTRPRMRAVSGSSPTLTTRRPTLSSTRII
jgi:hypothetical protein